MTWLAPYFLACAAAIAAPILFHLWRRTPRGRRPFSTLMFLTPSPPRVTSLSRIEHWLLLLLRCAALCLIALAFSRPVLRIPAVIPITPDETELVAVLVDTSASLQRGDLWGELQGRLNERLKQLSSTTVVALYHFDDHWSTELSFSESLPLQPTVSRSLLDDRRKLLKPGPAGSQLGEGLVRTAQALQEAQTGRTIPCPQRIILVSDLQEGSNLAALREFDWPADLPVEWISPEKVIPNAGLQLVQSLHDSGDDSLRVRVSNSLSASTQQFELVWGDEAKTPCLTVVVPPGQSRVVSLPSPPSAEAGRSIFLQGDEEPFDNRLWLPVRQPRQCTVVYLGSDAPGDINGPRYYLERALSSNPRYEVTLATGNAPFLSDSLPVLVVASEEVPEQGDLLAKLATAGVDVLLVPRDARQAAQLTAACGLPNLQFEESSTADYSTWSEIDYESTWFAAFAEAQFSDFSGIHFWKHRRLVGNLPPRSHVLTRFDTGEPAIVQWPGTLGGVVWLMASGWQPQESQLSRSSKFVPLMWRILEQSLGDLPATSSQQVGSPLRKPVDEQRDLQVLLPNGQQVVWPAAEVTFKETREPGRYEVILPESRQIIAMNLSPEESRTDPLAPEQLEAVGIPLSTKSTRPALSTRADELRQQQIQELEDRQQLWKWLLLGAGGFIVAETLLSAWWQRTRQAGLAESDPVAVKT